MKWKQAKKCCNELGYGLASLSTNNSLTEMYLTTKSKFKEPGLGFWVSASNTIFGGSVYVWQDGGIFLHEKNPNFYYKESDNGVIGEARGNSDKLSRKFPKCVQAFADSSTKQIGFTVADCNLHNDFMCVKSEILKSS